MFKRTPLYDEHVRLNARLVEFAGFKMPVQYTGLVKEHEAVRTAVGMFDVSHMGEFLISGEKARAFLNFVTTNDIDKLYKGRCQYNLMCYENGTVVDDVIVSQLSDHRYLMVVNAANREKDFAWLMKHKPDDVVFQDLSDDLSLIAVQGPKSVSVLEKIFSKKFSDLKYYHFEQILDPDLAKGVLVSRTGYTGEDGFEILLPNEKAVGVWQALLKLDVMPIGLGARDTLRLEAAYSLYGHEISDEILALEAGLGWVVKLDKGDFIGREALQNLKEHGVKRKLVGLELSEPGVARERCLVLDVQKQEIGTVTSGTHSPTLEKAIALALVRTPFSEIGTQVLVDIRGKHKKALVVKTPFLEKNL